MMKLGAFSISLSVKDIEQSKVFYQKLGFEVAGGDQSQNWLIMRNGDNVVGLFQGMFEGNALTFNPGWDQQCQTLDSFDDVREIEQSLVDNGIELISKTQSESGPGSIMLKDPDGNMIMLDQHV